MKKKKSRKERKLLINLYLERSLIERCDAIVNDADTIFEDRSSLLRFFIKQQLPILETEVKKQKTGETTT